MARDRKKVTMPHMGSISYVVGKFLFEKLGFEVMIPPPIEQRTIREGIRLAPEQFCMPLKISMGDIKRCLEMGAEAVVYPTEVGACRFRRYWNIIKLRLDECFQKDIPFFPLIGGNVLQSIMEIAKREKLSISLKQCLDLLRTAAEKVDRVTQIEELVDRVFPRTEWKQDLRVITIDHRNKVFATDSPAKLDSLTARTKQEIESLPQNSHEIPKLLMIGEIYDLLEPAVNHNLVQKLGRMGAEVKKAIGYNHLLGLEAYRLKEAMAKTRNKTEAVFMEHFSQISKFGGLGAHNISFARMAKKMGYDGIVHVYPFGCMPEIIAKPFVEEIARKDHIPVLFVELDEHFHEELFDSRLEAFVDVVYGLYGQKMNRIDHA